MIDKKYLRGQIPYGYLSKVAERASVSLKAVYDYFSDRTNSQKIEKAALEIAAELANEKRALLNQLQ